GRERQRRDVILAHPVEGLRLEGAVAADVLAAPEQVAERLARLLVVRPPGDARSPGRHLEVEELPAAAVAVEAAAALHHRLEREHLDDRPDRIPSPAQVELGDANGTRELLRVAVEDAQALAGHRRELVQAAEVPGPRHELATRGAGERHGEPDREPRPSTGRHATSIFPSRAGADNTNPAPAKWPPAPGRRCPTA